MLKVVTVKTGQEVLLMVKYCAILILIKSILQLPTPRPTPQVIEKDSR